METASIKNIRDVRDLIREKIKSVNYTANKDNTYGNENEYRFRGIIGGLENILVDVTTLTKAPNKFLAVSTYEERNSIYSYLNHINNYFETPNNFIPQFESLKILLRSYNVRSSMERQIEFENEIGNVIKLKIQVEEAFNEVKSLREKINSEEIAINEKFSTSIEKLEEISEELDKISAEKHELIQNVESLKSYNQDLEDAKDEADKNLKEIVASLNESKSNEKLIKAFASKVLESDQRLIELELKIEENTGRLNNYDIERVKILNEANELILSAKTALNYKTAEGISSSFQVQYESSNNKLVLGSWITGAIVCLIITIGLGVWILHAVPNNLIVLIARISLMPIPVIGAIFCANQYTKQKNIVEDYAYKMVLSKAIVGFSEQLKKNGTENNEEYIHYIKTALEEIHKDPLRKRVSPKLKLDNKDNLEQISDLIEKLSKLLKTNG